jgi:hypothetical protein
MRTIRVSQRTEADGVLSLKIPLGKPEADFDVVVLVQAKDSASSPEDRGWPPGYFDLAGSIDDETFVRPPRGDLPMLVDVD